ncbi:hypothetical protein LSH36_121g08011 [Paralvinella palmiformis]|uniref:NADH-ubiquinone oxidoreductase 9 kDa subunit n=1 Tax=Paralvinella palmiformis TaxID=53620 RepID=A0AAD9N8K6_9ANNE|nr:hypothetical protein LSH36_121g08011 [Paralvinella palmiformis]
MATLIIRRAKCLAPNNVNIFKALTRGVADKKTTNKKSPAAASEAPKASKPSPVGPKVIPATKPTVVPPSTAGKSAAATEDPTKYHADEYFGFNNYSFYDIDVTISGSRIKPPSKYAPLKP